MTRQDEERFIEFVKGTGNISVLPYESPTAEFSNVKTLAEPFSVPSWSFLWLYNRDIKPEPITEYVPQQKYYEVERFRSPVIEFSAESTLDALPVSRSLHTEWRIRFGYYPGGHCTRSTVCPQRGSSSGDRLARC